MKQSDYILVGNPNYTGIIYNKFDAIYYYLNGKLYREDGPSYIDRTCKKYFTKSWH